MNKEVFVQNVRRRAKEIMDPRIAEQARQLDKDISFLKSLGGEGAVPSMGTFSEVVQRLVQNPLWKDTDNETKLFVSQCMKDNVLLIHRNALKPYVLITNDLDVADFIVMHTMSLPGFKGEIEHIDPRAQWVRSAYTVLDALAPQEKQNFCMAVCVLFPRLPLGPTIEGKSSSMGLRGLIESGAQGSKPILKRSLTVSQQPAGLVHKALDSEPVPAVVRDARRGKDRLASSDKGEPRLRSDEKQKQKRGFAKEKYVRMAEEHLEVSGGTDKMSDEVENRSYRPRFPPPNHALASGLTVAMGSLTRRFKYVVSFRLGMSDEFVTLDFPAQPNRLR